MRYGTHITLALLLVVISLKMGISWEVSKFILLGMLTLSLEYVGKTMLRLWNKPIFHNLFFVVIATLVVYSVYGKLKAEFYFAGISLHVLLDIIKKSPKGFKLFYPFSDKVYSLNIASDYSKFDNYLLSALIVLTFIFLLL